MQKIWNVLMLSGLLGVTSGCAVVAVGAVGAAAATGAAVGTDPRSSGGLVDDNSIQSKLAAKYNNDENFPNSNIYVDVFNKQVLLTGQIKDMEQKSFAENVARGYPGVIKIYNYLELRLPSSLSSRSKDSMITTQVKARLFGTRGIPSNNIKVVSTNSVVYLMGMVTAASAESAANIAAKVAGVTKVITMFDYQNK
jgi:osmotically-inducible protein OsmY